MNRFSVHKKKTESLIQQELVDQEEDQIKFCDTSNDSEINFLDENYQTNSKPNEHENSKNDSSSFDLHMIPNQEEILDSFVLKEDEENNSLNNSINNQYESHDENSSSNSNIEEIIFDDDLDHFRTNNNSNATSRIRKFSDQIRDQLERHFLLNNFISGSEKSKLARKLNLTERQVQKWFVHRREKLRRLEKKAHLLNSTLKQQKGSLRLPIKIKLPTLPALSKQKPENPYQKVYVTKGGTALSQFVEANAKRDISNSEENEDVNDEIELYENTNDNLTWNEENEYSLVNEKEEEPQTNYYSQFAIVNDDDDFFPDDDQSKELSSEYLIEEMPFSSGINNKEMNSNISIQKIKSSRRLFPPNVVTHLEKIFDQEKYLNENRLAEVARVTKLNEKQIRSWFKQRRYRYNQERKQNGVDIDLGFKKRDNLPHDVVVELEKAFSKNNFVSGEDKKSLSRRLGLKPIQVERWFYYRRKKLTGTNLILD